MDPFWHRLKGLPMKSCFCQSRKGGGGNQINKRNYSDAFLSTQNHKKGFDILSLLLATEKLIYSSSSPQTLHHLS